MEPRRANDGSGGEQDNGGMFSIRASAASGRLDASSCHLTPGEFGATVMHHRRLPVDVCSSLSESG